MDGNGEIDFNEFSVMMQKLLVPGADDLSSDFSQHK